MSKKDTKSTIKFFGAWDNLKEETWLSEMSAAGWHLFATSPFVYRFKRGENRGYTYRMDFQGAVRFDAAEYVDIFRDAGWEHIAAYAGWHYFRADTGSGPLPEIYSDEDSKRQKFRRILSTIIIVCVLNLYFFVFFPNALTMIRREEWDWFSVLLLVVKVLNGLCAGMLGYAAVKLRRVLSLKHS